MKNHSKIQFKNFEKNSHKTEEKEFPINSIQFHSFIDYLLHNSLLWETWNPTRPQNHYSKCTHTGKEAKVNWRKIFLFTCYASHTLNSICSELNLYMNTFDGGIFFCCNYIKLFHIFHSHSNFSFTSSNSISLTRRIPSSCFIHEFIYIFWVVKK